MLSCVQLFAFFMVRGAHQTPLSTEFPRQEYWSGLPFPSQDIFPMQGFNLHFLHWQEVLYHWVTSSVQFSSVAQWCLTLCDPMNCSTPGLPVHQSRLLFPFPRDLLDTGIETESSALSCIAGGFFTHWATWEAQLHIYMCIYLYSVRFLSITGYDSSLCCTISLCWLYILYIVVCIC